MHFNENETISSQIADSLRKKIYGGSFTASDKLPPIRELAVEYKVNPNTVVKVYNELEEEGLIFTERTNGKFVIEDKNLLEKKKISYIRQKVTEFLHSVEECNIGKNELINILKEDNNDIRD